MAAIPADERRLYILQERMRFAPVIDTPHGATQAEVRMMCLWTDRLRPVLPLIRMGRGQMMGVAHNQGLAWVGASAGFAGAGMTPGGVMPSRRWRWWRPPPPARSVAAGSRSTGSAFVLYFPAMLVATAVAGPGPGVLAIVLGPLLSELAIPHEHTSLIKVGPELVGHVALCGHRPRHGRPRRAPAARRARAEAEAEAAATGAARSWPRPGRR